MRTGTIEKFRLNKHFDRLGTRGSRTARTPGHAHSKPNLVAGSRAVYALQHQFKTEGQLELADHHDRRVFSTQGDEIAPPTSPLTGEAEPFEITLHEGVECRLSPAASIKVLRSPRLGPPETGLH
jgi:hypothetical protein